MTSLALPIVAAAPGRVRLPIERFALGTAAPLTGLLAAALLRRLLSGAALLPVGAGACLALHLAAVLPALPLGGYLLWARKGDRLHRLLGRLWALLMMATALSSFGLRHTGHLGWIHLLAAATVVSVPWGVVQAVRGRVAGHRRTMARTYAGLVIAGLFTLAPDRLMGAWLFG